MLIFPAIDLYEGRVVRLYKGDYDRMTVYSDDPVAVAKAFAAEGAGCIHIVDLEGARYGGTPNFKTICDIKRATGLFCEVGGGIRDVGTAMRYIDAGIDRIITGTAAVTDRGFMKEVVKSTGGAVAVGIDVRNGHVSIRGWTEDTSLDAIDFCKAARDAGIGTVICTDISKDGAMNGTNRELYIGLSSVPGIDVIASGGVSTLDDVIALRDIGVYGAIIGKAYYAGAIRLKEAIGAAK